MTMFQSSKYFFLFFKNLQKSFCQHGLDKLTQKKVKFRYLDVQRCYDNRSRKRVLLEQEKPRKRSKIGVWKIKYSYISTRRG